MALKSPILIIIGSTLMSATSIADVGEAGAPTTTLDQYVQDLVDVEGDGGSLYCESENGGERQVFSSCAAFLKLREQGCFGRSMREIYAENAYSGACDSLRIFRGAKNASVHYFELSSPNWWKSLPADIIPTSGGIYSDESWKIEISAREKLVAGKLLADISFLEKSGAPGYFEGILDSWVNDCGEVHDRFQMKAMFLADFDGDEVAELVVEGYRVSNSDTCQLGSGNSLGARFSALIQKVDAQTPPTKINFPNSD